MRKLEVLNDEAIAFLETQVDLLLTMPEHCRRDRWRVVGGTEHHSVTLTFRQATARLPARAQRR
jgi:hypothetical protein